MIIFDLDTLADCEHRRHFVDVYKAIEKGIAYEDLYGNIGGIQSNGFFLQNDSDRRWKSDWTAFYEACDKDVSIGPVCQMWNNYEVKIATDRVDLQIWSGRCESVRKQTISWLDTYLFGISEEWWSSILKMRPIGDTTPADKLKEKWLDEYLNEPSFNNLSFKHPNDLRVSGDDKKIEMVFDSDPDSIIMWKKRGIFVFNCSQEK